MKLSITLIAACTLAGCTAAQQQRFADGYFGEPGHTFREAMVGTGNDIDLAIGSAATGYANASQAYGYAHPHYAGWVTVNYQPVWVQY